MSRRADSWVLALAIALGATVCWLPAWQAAARYHGGYSVAETAAYLLLPALAAVLLAGMAAALGARGRQLLCALLLLTALYLLHKFVRGLLPAAPALPPYAARTVIFLLCAASWLAAARLADAFWRQLGHVVIAAALLFALTPYALLMSDQAGAYPVFSLASPYALASPSRNTLAILLDETGPEFTAPLLKAAQERQLRWASVVVPAAGANTVNAIPAMLTGKRFDNVAPCGPSWLCSPTRSLDFGQLYAGRPDLDIVGFWHPYCAIRGLRYCRRIAGVFYPPPARSFLCSPPYLPALLNCRPAAGSRDAAVDRLLAAAYAAPFWREGGMLYLHLPLPHPSMETRENLRSHYLANLADASQVLGQLLDKMRSRFGDDFSVIVTSDHPLRTEGWCRPEREYHAADCGLGLPANRKRVPFIVISPRLAEQPRMPADNLGVFHGAARS
ncbi:sulfatase-like hydrolase/transferase [Chromobacterium subtsugae]|uniref:sulfatase-like hydrolase/transferase n=1 Tax=Chromobacterium subtsugae TaxID=251747 RepID=UPI000640D813|nr:sulfatase-like hydrolase/transferase [Chromobacterium subtsugae]